MDGRRLNALLSDPAATLDRVAAAVSAIGPDFPGESEVVSTLDELAEGAPSDTEGLLGHVFGSLGFRGNSESFYETDNSLIHRVLERRRGNPLSLAIVAAEIGRRRGLALEPVGMPGHVLLGDGSGQRWFDAFAGGRELDMDECAEVFTRLFPGRLFDAGTLHPMTALAIATRNLQNLRLAAIRTGHLGFLASVLRLCVSLPGSVARDQNDLAKVLGALGRFEEAAEHHDQLAEMHPADADHHRRAAVRHRARNN